MRKDDYNAYANGGGVDWRVRDLDEDIYAVDPWYTSGPIRNEDMDFGEDKIRG